MVKETIRHKISIKSDRNIFMRNSCVIGREQVLAMPRGKHFLKPARDDGALWRTLLMM